MEPRISFDAKRKDEVSPPRTDGLRLRRERSVLFVRGGIIACGGGNNACAW
jgi:hypothetical protein